MLRLLFINIFVFLFAYQIYAEDCVALYKQTRAEKGSIGQTLFIEEFCSGTKKENQDACEKKRQELEKNDASATVTFNVSYECMVSSKSGEPEA